MAGAQVKQDPYTVPFTYKDGSFYIAAGLAGAAIREISVQVDDGFDDASSTIQIGTGQNQGLLISKGDVKLSQYGIYTFSIQFYFSAPYALTVYAFIDKKLSTRGSGRIYVMKDM